MMTSADGTIHFLFIPVAIIPTSENEKFLRHRLHKPRDYSSSWAIPLRPRPRFQYLKTAFYIWRS